MRPYADRLLSALLRCHRSPFLPRPTKMVGLTPQEACLAARYRDSLRSHRNLPRSHLLKNSSSMMQMIPHPYRRRQSSSWGKHKSLSTRFRSLRMLRNMLRVLALAAQHSHLFQAPLVLELTISPPGHLDSTRRREARVFCKAAVFMTGGN